MADANPTKDPAAGASADQVAAGVEKLHLDESTGEMVSKSELKKRIKAREKEAKKKAAATAAGPATTAAAPKAANAEAGEHELTPNQVLFTPSPS